MIKIFQGNDFDVLEEKINRWEREEDKTLEAQIISHGKIPMTQRNILAASTFIQAHNGLIIITITYTITRC